MSNRTWGKAFFLLVDSSASLSLTKSSLCCCRRITMTIIFLFLFLLFLSSIFHLIVVGEYKSQRMGFIVYLEVLFIGIHPMIIICPQINTHSFPPNSSALHVIRAQQEAAAGEQVFLCWSSRLEPCFPEGHRQSPLHQRRRGICWCIFLWKPSHCQRTSSRSQTSNSASPICNKTTRRKAL